MEIPREKYNIHKRYTSSSSNRHEKNKEWERRRKFNQMNDKKVGFISDDVLKRHLKNLKLSEYLIYSGGLNKKDNIVKVNNCTFES